MKNLTIEELETGPKISQCKNQMDRISLDILNEHLQYDCEHEIYLEHNQYIEMYNNQSSQCRHG